LVVALALAAIAVVRVFWAFVLVFVVVGVCHGMLYALALDQMLAHEESHKGRRAGLFESLIGAGAMAAPFVGGLLAQGLLVLPYLAAGLLCLLIYGVSGVLLRRG
jgi:MFS family permease